jgi:hypothetical protein
MTDENVWGSFFIWPLVGGDRSASRPCRFTPKERIPGTHCIGGWVDPGAGLEHMEKWKFLNLTRLELRPIGSQTLASRYTDWATAAVIRLIKRDITITAGVETCSSQFQKTRSRPWVQLLYSERSTFYATHLKCAAKCRRLGTTTA